MADNSTLPATGDVVAADEISAVKYQRIKLIHGVDGVNDGDVSLTNPLPVEAGRDLQRIAVTSAGLTIATTAYTAGDQLGTQLTFANAARASGGSGVVVGLTIVDVNDIIGPVDLVLFDSSVTLAADNAAFAVSDADALKVVQLIPTAVFDIGSNRVSQIMGLAIPYVCNGGTSLFGGLLTRTGHTFFAATTDLTVVLYVERN